MAVHVCRVDVVNALIEAALAAGADGFLLKPFTMHQLTETVSAVVSAMRNVVGSQVDLLSRGSVFATALMRF